MGSYIEQWGQKLRAGTKKVEDLAVGVYRTKPETVIGTPGIKMRFLVVGDQGYRGLPEGVYVETNLVLEAFLSNPDFQNAIMSHAHEALRDRRFPLLNFGNLETGPRIYNKITHTAIFVSLGGRTVLKIEPALPSDLERVCRNTGPAFPRPSLN